MVKKIDNFTVDVSISSSTPTGAYLIKYFVSEADSSPNLNNSYPITISVLPDDLIATPVNKDDKIVFVPPI